MKLQAKLTYGHRNKSSSCLGWGEADEKGHREAFQGDENTLHLDEALCFVQV